MNVYCAENIVNHLQLLDKLRSCLEKQIELTCQGNIREVERMGEQVNSLVTNVTLTAIFKQDKFQKQRTEIKKLFNTLSLALVSHKHDAGSQLKTIRKSRRVLGIYRNSI